MLRNDDSSRIDRLAAAEAILGHDFADRDLLERALTHPSFADETASSCDYERLEFLGDAVLGLIVVEEIFRRFPDLPEGVMTKIKITVVSGTTLTEAAADLGLAELLLLGSSERGTGGRGMTSALENAFEALVGALYLDGGMIAAHRFVMRVLGRRIVPEAAEELEHPKSRLQEMIQAEGSAPHYEITSIEGPPHDRKFTAEVLVAGKVLGTGTGHSKKEAEMNAATQALTSLLPSE